jgi:hypothetical protein
VAGSSEVDLVAAFAAIDAANADDPFTIVARGVERPKEQAHAEMAVEWVRKLDPQASDALLVAARAHHVRRWEIARSTEDEGREGYLRWKNRLQRHHAEIVGRILPGAGVDPATVTRVQDLVRKRRLKTDPEVRTLEDALCLVFVETQFSDLADKLEEDHMVDVVAKSLAKMTTAGRAAALTLALDEEATRIVGRALAIVTP